MVISGGPSRSQTSNKPDDRSDKSILGVDSPSPTLQTGKILQTTDVAVEYHDRRDMKESNEFEMDRVEG